MRDTSRQVRLAGGRGEEEEKRGAEEGGESGSRPERREKRYTPHLSVRPLKERSGEKERDDTEKR